MLAVGQTVVYGTQGVCTVREIDVYKRQGLYGLAVTGALLDDGNEDVEERYRRIQAEQEAKNIGAVIGLVAGVAMVLTQDEQSSTEQQWTEDQQAEQTQQQTM